MLKYLSQAGIILAFSFVGEALHLLVPLPVPGSVYGLLLLLLCLCLGVVRPRHIVETAQALTALMPVMFVPATVGLMQSWERMKQSLPALLLAILPLTAVVMGVSALVVQAVEKKEGTHDLSDR